MQQADIKVTSEERLPVGFEQVSKCPPLAQTLLIVLAWRRKTVREREREREDGALVGCCGVSSDGIGYEDSGEGGRRDGEDQDMRTR